MPPFLILLAVGVLAWRYRAALGLDRWEEQARPHVARIAENFGFRSRSATPLPARPSTTAPPAPRQPGLRGRLRAIDGRQLPAALAAGFVVAVAGSALDLTGHNTMAQLVVLLIGPFVGGVLLKSWWWVGAIAPGVAALLGAGSGLLSLVVALPVVAIAYGGWHLDYLFKASRPRRRRR